jgi:biopolymer transport protein ExbD
MRRKRRIRRRTQGEVELNLAAMLDMAFQLLAFFILTFRPSPIEGQVLLHMPPPRPVTVLPNAQDAGEDKDNPNPVQGLNTLVITVLGSPNGQIEELSIGEGVVPGISALAPRLKTLLSDPGSGFDQVMIQVSSNVKYQALMDVVDICTRQTLPNGDPLSKLGFAELPSG